MPYLSNVKEIQSKHLTISMPIVIIGNKFHDKEEVTPDLILENFEANKLAECGLLIQSFSIDVLSENEKIIEAVRWLLKQII